VVGDEGMGDEETNVTALLGLTSPVFWVAEGVFSGERRQDFVGEAEGKGIWTEDDVSVVDERRRDSVHFRVREVVWFSFSLSLFEGEDERESWLYFEGESCADEL